ncbi:MAG: AAA family ATPase [Methylococcales bacterium]|nr:AAA family ATPase [Methylococcales bacterium]
MKIDVKVKNLGRIKEAEFKVRPITVITGSNGTGKSFFTKSLYSILNVVNKNVYYESINKTIRQLQLQLSSFTGTITYPSTNDVYNINKIESLLKILQNELNEASGWKINDFLAFTESKLDSAKKIQYHYSSYLNELKSKPSKINSVASISNTINKTLNLLITQLNTASNLSGNLINENIGNELKDNFQISSLNELISFGEISAEISVESFLHASENLLNIKFSDKDGFLELGANFIDEVASLSSVVFFESPAYWKVRDALKLAKDNPNIPVFLRKKNNDILTGVPKYFYDLDTLLRLKTKTSSSFKEIANSLEKTLGGEFIFEGDELFFKDNQTGRKISKHLVSFGMTNLGMIQALLKYNIITKGSFVFIDEPETNLHPDWQVILMNVLLELSDKGVNVVIATHSVEILKSIEVGIKKRADDDINDFLSVHFVDIDGLLFEFESNNSKQQLIEARSLLNSVYERLYFSGL